METNEPIEYGLWIRVAREARGESVEAIAEVLRIDSRYLEALEAGNIALLPEPYMRAFLLTYAGYLGLDAAEAVRRFEAYHQAQKRGLEAVQAAVQEKQGRRPPAGSGGAAATTDGHTSGGNGKSRTSGARSGLGGWSAAAGVMLLFAAVTWLVVRGLDLSDESTAPTGPAGRSVPLVAAPDTVSAQPPPLAEPVQAEPPPAPVREGERADPAPPGSPREASPRTRAEFRVEALEEVWVQIVSGRDTLVSRIMNEGQQVRIPFADTLVVRMGKNRGARLFLDERELNDLGSPGMVLSRLVVTPTGVVERRLVFPPDEGPRNEDDPIRPR